MKKKKIILIILLLMTVIGLSVLIAYKNNDNSSEEEKVIQSNDRDEKKEQFEVINDYINIREENDTKSGILGKVYKGEIYTILDRKEDEYYVWYQIETNTNIKGYVAVKYLEEVYIKDLEVKEIEDSEEASE